MARNGALNRSGKLFASNVALCWGEVKDGYDICEWLAGQPWCTAMVGSFGGSQGGYAQNYLAVAQPREALEQHVDLELGALGGGGRLVAGEYGELLR